jgi:ABC-type multidrug transport system fused ATPase/permease subunit
LFKEVSFKVQSGSKLALLGANASGKTTLVDLLYGIKEAVSGVVLIDGSDYRDISKENIREQVALVRGLEILPDTILENVRIGRKDITLEQVREALSKIGLLDEVMALPEGLQTILSVEGRPFSIAQVHRLVLARAIVAQPRLLLVDETLDDLDEESRETALKVLFSKDAPWTLVIATHDTALAKRCEQVVSLGDLTHRRSA